MFSARTVLRTVMAAIALVSAAVPAAAQAKSRAVEPLNQYLVSGKISGDDLARRGYDMHEAVVPGAHGAFAIVATPSAAA